MATIDTTSSNNAKPSASVHGDEVAISVRDLCKNFGEKRALNGATLALRSGEILGLLGPNGAGKSTLIRSLVGRVRPNSGTISILGAAAGSDAARRKLGYVPQDLALYPLLSAAENLEVFGRYHGLEGAALADSVAWCLKWSALEDRAAEQVKNYSGGMKRRLNMAAGLIHRPQIILMDEPTVGVDPQSRERIFTMIEELHAQGISILYTTHYMEEAERLCDRIAIIDHGQVIADGSNQELVTRSFGTDRKLVVQFTGEPQKAAADWLQSMGASIHGASAEIAIKNPVLEVVEFLNKANAHGMNIHDFSLITPNLESVFLKLTGRGLRE